MKGKETFRVYPGTPFCDIGECPYREAIARCYSRGWFLGMTATRFGPDRPMERAMLAAVLHRVAGCPQPPRRGLFFDVSPPLLAPRPADWCACQGILLAWARGRFFPGRAVSWEELLLACGGGRAAPAAGRPQGNSGPEPGASPCPRTCTGPCPGGRPPRRWTAFSRPCPPAVPPGRIG